MTLNVRLTTKTVGASNTEYEGRTIDEIIVGQARLSSSREVNDLFNEPQKLLRYCILNQHWSVFDQASLGIEITCARYVSAQLLRHKSFFPQEFSQRYAEVPSIEPIELRSQTTTNRQSSSQVITDEQLNNRVDLFIDAALDLYKELVNNNVAKECAREILPLSATTKINLNGTIRSYITMLNTRLHKTTQKEHRELAQLIRDIIIQECPIIAACLYNFEYAEDVHILDRLVLDKYGVFELVKSNSFKRITRELVYV